MIKKGWMVIVIFRFFNFFEKKGLYKDIEKY